jgi:hypothetical protein
MVAARVLGAAQIARVCERERGKAVVPTVDCGLVPRKVEGFFA